VPRVRSADGPLQRQEWLDRYVAAWLSYDRDEAGGPVVRTYDNCFVLRFDDEDRCRDFTEYYIRRP
jgi:hypothetical protein